jgi:hypothetical protein
MASMNDFLNSFFLEHTSLMNRLGALLMKANLIFLNYPVNPEPRYGYGRPPHPELYRIIAGHEATYQTILSDLLEYTDDYLSIPRIALENDPAAPAWINRGIGTFDALQIYGFLCKFNPSNYFELGSGASTAFARRAINDHGLKTRILSFGPNPRYEIDEICDYTCRLPIEETDLSVFDELAEGDIIFVDDGHRVFENHGPTVFFLDIFPRLKKGVIVGVHDIFLPYDYPPEWLRLYYSEQYLLAAYLLSNSERYEILLPCKYVSENPRLREIMSDFWADPRMKGTQSDGISFWMRIK